MIKKYNFATLKETEAELMKNPVFKSAWDARANQRRITHELIEARIKRKLSQRKLAESIGIKQSSLARVEGGKHMPSIAMLDKIATGLGKKLEIRFV